MTYNCPMSAPKPPLIGTWKLVSWEVVRPDGRIHYPYGKDVVGFLIYTADGYMSAEIMDPDRQQSAPGFPLEIASAQTLPQHDRARAYSTYLSYCGTYSVEGNILTHHVKAGLIPSWVGSQQIRHFTFEHGSLIISSGNQKLVWERAANHA